MKTSLARMLLAASIAFAPSVVAASESDFLTSLEGNWTGTGTVKVRADASPVSISCKFNSDAAASSLALNGNCRGLFMFSRAVSANLKANGSSYKGSYLGAGSGKAGLQGRRNGNAINLTIRWAKEVNGDRDARLVVEKKGSNGMQLTTVDKDPTTGKEVITSQINLRRA